MNGLAEVSGIRFGQSLLVRKVLGNEWITAISYNLLGHLEGGVQFPCSTAMGHIYYDNCAIILAYMLYTIFIMCFRHLCAASDKRAWLYGKRRGLTCYVMR